MFTRRRKIAVFLVLVILVAIGACQTFKKPKPVPVGQPTAAPEGDGWIDLLAADQEANWDNITDDLDIYELSDGVLHIFGKTIYPLRYVGYTAEEFGDFDLHLEVKLANRANSGIFVRSQADDPVYRGFEIQVLEDFGKPPTKNSAGSIYDVATPMFNMSRPAGEWNSYDISLRGPEVVVYMNGWRVVHVNLDQLTTPVGKFDVAYKDIPREGMLMFQDHGGEAWYRNIRLRRADDAPEGLWQPGP
jgi:hypothetical protein